MSVAAEARVPEAVRDRLVGEARGFFAVDRVVLLGVAGREGRVEALVSSPVGPLPDGSLAISDFPPLGTLLERGGEALRVSGDEAATLAGALGADSRAKTLLLLPMRSGDALRHVLVLADRVHRRFEEREIEVGGAFAAAASASLAQMGVAEDHAAQVAQQAALARAAKSLNESLDLSRVLGCICREAASILDADNAAVYRGNATDGVVVEATHGLPPEATGYRMEPGSGLAGKVAELDRPLITNDYQGMPRKPDHALFGDVTGCLAVPMHWDGQLRGVLAVGYRRPYLVTRDHLGLLEAFGELAAAACRNASEHAGLALAARTDGLTGCLNHAAAHEALGREIERCERTGHRLALALVDMDDFKRVNEDHGHLAGDDVLRRVGIALRQAVRPDDLVARYGGDEFALVAVGADEHEATEVAHRALTSVARALGDHEPTHARQRASAGVAEWEPGDDAAGLIDRADRALLYGKQVRGRGAVTAAATLPKRFRPNGRSRVHGAPAAAPVFVTAWPGAGREQTERLRKRTRQLSLANALGTRLAAMTDPMEIMEAAVDELHRAFGYFLCAVIRVRDDGFVQSAAGRGEAFVRLGEQNWCQPRGAGIIGRCLRERRPVIIGDVRAEPDYMVTPETEDVRAELCVPLWVGDELYGAINLEEVRPGAFDDDDARLLQTVADQVGSALRSATLYERLDRAYRSGN